MGPSVRLSSKGGRGGTLIFSCVYVCSGYFFIGWGGGGHNFVFQYFWGFSEEDFVDIFLIITKLELINMHFIIFSEGQGTEWKIFLGLLKFQILICGA